LGIPLSSSTSGTQHVRLKEKMYVFYCLMHRLKLTPPGTSSVFLAWLWLGLRWLWLSKTSGQAVYGGSDLALAWLSLSCSLRYENMNKFRIHATYTDVPTAKVLNPTYKQPQ
jgi:hypothetical protein